VKEIREVGMAEELRPAVYRLHEQADQVMSEPRGIVVRTAVEPASIVSAVRQAIWSIDKNQPIWHVQTLKEIVNRQLSTPTQSTTLMSAFALLSLHSRRSGYTSTLHAVTQRNQRDRRAHGIRRDFQGHIALLRWTRLEVDACRSSWLDRRASVAISARDEPLYDPTR